MYQKGVYLNDFQITRIKDCMSIARYNQASLSKALGITQPQLSKILNGKRTITELDINKMAVLFNVPASYLTLQTDYMHDISDNSVRAILDDDPMTIDEGFHPLFLAYLNFYYDFTFHIVHA